MKRILIIVGSLTAVGVLVWLLMLKPSLKTTTSDGVTQTNASPAPSNSTTSATKTGYKDGVYTGTGSQNRYGTVQVKVTISGGKITDVSLLQMPDGEDRSKRISEAERGVLIQEALTAQSANVDIISGATETSQSFRESLTDALSQA